MPEVAMKKVKSLLSIVIIVVFIATATFAHGLTLNFDGADHDMTGKTYTVEVNGKTVDTDVPAFLLYDKYPVIPLRAVFEAMGGSVDWEQSTKSIVVGLDNWIIKLRQDEKEAEINGKIYTFDVPVIAASSGSYGRTMVPLTLLSDLLNVETNISGETKVISVEYIKPENTPAPQSSDKPVAKPKASPTPSPSSKPDEPSRGGGDRPTVPAATPKASPSPGAATPEPTPTPSPNNTQQNTPQPGTTPSADPQQSPGPQSPEPAPSVVPSPLPELEYVITDVLYFNSDGTERIEILFNNRKGYKVTRLSNPNRIVVDFNDARAGVIGSRTNTIQGSIVKKYGLTQYDPTTARVEIEVAGTPDYDIYLSGNKVVLVFRVSNLRNISYTGDKDRVCLLLKGAKLTEGEAAQKKLYQEQYSSDGRTYTITFPSNLADLGTGRLTINDKYLDSVVVETNASKSTTTITFNAKEKLSYVIFTRTETNDTAITLLKPRSTAEKLVVIDPGHGGVDPGAVSGNVQEKTLNLDIALKLNKLLKEKGVNTYMIREDDIFVGLYERAYIANALNASLFICIHNNAATATSASGTETLYTQENPYDKNLFGKRFAQIIQESLVSRLKSVDRKIQHRPGLVVLKATRMPAALAEIGFITNSYERSNLLREDYRLAAAQALCDAVIKALGELK